MRYALRKIGQLTGARKVLTAWRPAPGIFSKANEARPGPPTRESVPHFLSARPGHGSRLNLEARPGHLVRSKRDILLGLKTRISWVKTCWKHLGSSLGAERRGIPCLLDEKTED